MHLTKSKIFLVSCLAFVGGVVGGSFLPVSAARFSLWFFAGAVAAAVGAALFWSRPRTRTAFLVGLFLFFGLWRYEFSWPVLGPDKVSFYNGRVVEIVGVVSREPERVGKNQKLVVEVERLTVEKEIKKVEKRMKGFVLMVVGLYPEYSYGDKLKIVCQLKKPEPFSGFAYDRYLARQNIYSVCFWPKKVEKISSGNRNWVYSWVLRLKQAGQQLVNRSLPEPEASLVRAIVFGDKKNLPSDLREDFSRAGLSHIVAISGMHIGIIGLLLLTFLIALGLERRQGFWLVSLFLLFYLTLVGWPASAMRAGVMGILAMVALIYGRLNRLTNALVLAAAILLLVNPRLGRDDIGFQLSFLAVLGIAWFYPALDKIFSGRKKKKRQAPAKKVLGKKMKPSQWSALWQNFVNSAYVARGRRLLVPLLALTLSAQALTWPLVAYYFNRVSLIAPVANILVVPILPALIVAVAAALALAALWPAANLFFFFPVWVLAGYIIKVAAVLSRLPGAALEISSVSLFLIGFYYAALFLFYLWLRR